MTNTPALAGESGAAVSVRCRAKKWRGWLWRSGVWNTTDGREGIVVTCLIECRAGHRKQWDIFRAALDEAKEPERV